MAALPARKHSVPVAVVASLLICGAGQVYNRQYAKGASAFVGALVFGPVLLFLVDGFGLPLFLLPYLAAVAVDAGRIASRVRAGRAVGKWEM